MELLDTLDASATRLETPCGDGVMVWRRWNARGGAPLVMLHGGSGNWLHWTRQIPVFAAQRMVLAPDLPGLGESAEPPGEHSPDNVAAVVAAGLRHLVPATEHIDLVGFSFGANIAGHVAALLTPALRSVTLLGAGSLGTPRNPVPLQKVRDKQGAARVAAHRHNLASMMIADPAGVDDLALAIQERAFINSRLRSRKFATATILADALARAPEIPVNAIWGDHDQLAWPDIQLRVAALRRARPDARMRLIPGAGHWVAFEAAAAVNALLAEWLREDR
jgi:pimeloyl-ACP methyl ester carboxylesterase